MQLGSPYMEWIKEVEFPRINFAKSGMGFSGKISELSVTVEELNIAQKDAYGSPLLKSVLSDRYGVPANQIFLNMGTSGANYLLFATLFQPGDEVLVEYPVYDPLPNALSLLGVKVKNLPRRFENGYQFDESEVEKYFTSKTRAIIITNLHNPSGVLITKESITTLASIAQKKNAWLIVDEVYLEFYFGKGPKTAVRLAENAIVTSSLTKAFGLGGLRAGWVFAPENLVNKMNRIYNLIAVNNSPLIEYIANKVLSNEKLFHKFSDNAKRTVQDNLPIVEKFLNSRSDIRWVKPDNGIICFPLLKSGELVEALYRKLFEEYQTLITPGRFFGEPRGFRLGYGIEKDKLEEGLNNISKVLNLLSDSNP